MTDALERFATTVRKGIFYSADSDDKGARVSTNLPDTICPRCKATVEPNAEHLCGDRVPKPSTPPRKR